MVSNPSHKKILHTLKGIRVATALDTVIVLVELAQDKTFAVEIYIQDIFTHSFYINRYYTDVFSYQDIMMDRLTGVLISDDLHYTFQHSVFRKFVDGVYLTGNYFY